MRRPKYGNRKVALDGHTFDSAKEAAHYQKLKALESSGAIAGLRLQVRFDLRGAGGTVVCRYVADFVYESGGRTVVEDVKSEITKKNPVYRLKRKLFRDNYGFDITEV